MVDACLLRRVEEPGVLASVHGMQVCERESPEASVARAGIISLGQRGQRESLEGLQAVTEFVLAFGLPCVYVYSQQNGPDDIIKWT